MKRTKGLVISWYFPPINSSEGLCTFKLLKNSKFTYDVYTQKNNKDWSYDTDETKLVSKNIKTIFSSSFDTNSWVKEGISKLNDKIDDYDFIMSRSMAPESHEIALELKRKNPNILWVASFGDPIANNPYEKFWYHDSPYTVKGKGVIEQSLRYVLSPKRVLKNLIWQYRNKTYKRKFTRFYKDKKLQDSVLNECDIIIFNNKYQMKYMLEGYPEKIIKKGIILPHGYDKSFYENKKKSISKDKFKISYLGHLDKIRTPRNFLCALERLKAKKRDLYNMLEIEIYGNMDDEDKVYIVDSNICDIVKFKKPVKYFDSLSIMQNSDLLLLIDANLGLYIPDNIFYAAKLADYIGSGSNILGITMLGGASSDIIREIGGVVSSHSTEDIYNNLVMILEKKIELHTLDKYNKYDIITISNNFDKIILDKVQNTCGGKNE